MDRAAAAATTPAVTRTNLIWAWAGVFSLAAGGLVLLAEGPIANWLAWLADSYRPGEGPLSASQVRSLHRGIELWGWSGLALGAASAPLWSARVRSLLAARLFGVVERLSRPLPLATDRYGGRFLLATGGVLLFTLLAHWSLTAYEEVDWLEGEDGVSEWWSVATYLVGAVLAGVTARHLQGTGHPRLVWFHGALAVLLFLGAMEEISWGQRLLGWSTPQAIQSVNQQGETTLHNVGLLDDVIAQLFFQGSLLALLAASARAMLHRRGRVTTADFILPSLALSPALLMILIWQLAPQWEALNLPRLLLDYFGYGPQGSEIPEVLLGLCVGLYTYANLGRASALRRLQAAPAPAIARGVVPTTGA